MNLRGFGSKQPFFAGNTSIITLIILYFVIVGTIILRINVEATNYLSPDSRIYIGVAENLLEGRGPVNPQGNILPKKPGEASAFFAGWPLGYPLTIAAFYEILPLTPFWASKVVNFVALAGIFILLHSWLGNRSWIPVLYFASYSKMEVFSYSWTEGMFVFIVLLLIHVLIRVHQKSFTPISSLLIAIMLCSLFCFRYAGAIYYFLVLFLIIFYLQRKELRKSVQLSLPLLFAGVFALVYLVINRQLTGYYTGFDRFHIWSASNFQFFEELFQGLINEFLFARNYWGDHDPILYITLIIQLLIAIPFIKNRKLLETSDSNRYEVPFVLFFSFGYLAFIVTLKYFLLFDTFNYRILAPFSTPLVIAFLSVMASENNKAYFERVKPYYVSFMLFCLIMNLPKWYLINLLFGINH